MAQQTSPAMTAAIEDAHGIPRGLIHRDPEAAAIIATTPCPKCGDVHGIKPCQPNRIGRYARIPVARV